MKCQVDAIQWGGGAEADSIQWGGGVVAECFRRLHRLHSVGGGGGGIVAEFFRRLQKPTRFSEGGSESATAYLGERWRCRLDIINAVLVNGSQSIYL